MEIVSCHAETRRKDRTPREMALFAMVDCLFCGNDRLEVCTKILDSMKLSEEQMRMLFFALVWRNDRWRRPGQFATVTSPFPGSGGASDADIVKFADILNKLHLESTKTPGGIIKHANSLFKYALIGFCRSDFALLDKLSAHVSFDKLVAQRDYGLQLSSRMRELARVTGGSEAKVQEWFMEKLKAGIESATDPKTIHTMVKGMTDSGESRGNIEAVHRLLVAAMFKET